MPGTSLDPSTVLVAGSAVRREEAIVRTLVDEARGHEAAAYRLLMNLRF
jgi:hypothetical protein